MLRLRREAIPDGDGAEAMSGATKWQPTSSPPARSGVYLCKDGRYDTDKEAWRATFSRKSRRWSDPITGAAIVFGARELDTDMWAPLSDGSPDMSPDLRLRGDIPDLLRRGAPVKFVGTERAWHGPRGIVTLVFDRAVTCCVTSHGGGADGNGEVRCADLELDLSDPLGLYTAILWLRSFGFVLPEALAGNVTCVAWSVLNVSRGGKPLAGILPVWVRLSPKDVHELRYDNRGGPYAVARDVVNEAGHGWWWTTSRASDEKMTKGPEVGEAAKQCSDTMALNDDYALTNEDGSLTFPALLDPA